MADDEPKPLKDLPGGNPLEILGSEFAELCLAAGTDVALANLIALQQRQGVRLRILLAYTDPAHVRPPAGIPAEIIELQGDMTRTLRIAETRMEEAEFWMTRAGAIRQQMTTLLGRKAPPNRDEGDDASDAQ